MIFSLSSATSAGTPPISIKEVIKGISVKFLKSISKSPYGNLLGKSKCSNK